MIKEISCGVVMFRREGRKRKYLLLHYAAGHWEFVKGNVEKGEDEKQTVVRETKEETGINDLTFVQDFKQVIHFFYRKDKNLISKQVTFYLAETKTEKVTLSFEHIGFEWLVYSKAIERLNFKNSKDVLKNAEELLNKSSE